MIKVIYKKEDFLIITNYLTIFTNGLEFFRDEKFGQAVRPGKDGFLRFD